MDSPANLHQMTEDELIDVLSPLTLKMRQLGDLYEADNFGTYAVSEMDEEVLRLADSMTPIIDELAKRYPEDPMLQQRRRDFRRFRFSLRGGQGEQNAI